MRIYRYEDKHGFGPYRDSRLGFLKRHARKPLPHEEGIGYLTEDKRSGCVSFEQLHTWFDKNDQERLEEEGYRVVTYEVPQLEVEYSNTQALFLTANAVVVETEFDED